MEERIRLGRGLEEISRLYLSDGPREAAPKEKKPEPQARNHQVIRIFHPGSGGVKAAFLANFALELARSRYHVTVWDCPGNEKPGVRDMLGGLIRPGLTPETGAVKLYGLPDILVHHAEARPAEALDELIRTGFSSVTDQYLLINSPDSIESLQGKTIAGDAVLLSAVDEASLLKCYAWIKVFLESDPSGRIYIALDDPGSEERAEDLFSRFAGFVKERLEASVSFLGSLTHDHLLERSMDERTPLVLCNDSSVAKDSLMAMNAVFLQSRQAGTV